MTLRKKSHCKINLLLNILGRRADGFHEVETVMHPVRVFDELSFTRIRHGVQLTCSNPELPVDSGNLVHRAAVLFFEKSGLTSGVRIHLDKSIPVAAGLGGGSGNAATALLGLNELFDQPLSAAALEQLAATMGSDIPFFLQSKPALATGRGENVQALDFFPALQGMALLLIHPGFGISTAWAYQALARFPAALNGHRGRAANLVSLLQESSPDAAVAEFYNSLEAPALEKYPLLALFQEFLREHGALVTLMSGSGSTTFALVRGEVAAVDLARRFKERFGETNWVATLDL